MLALIAIIVSKNELTTLIYMYVCYECDIMALNPATYQLKDVISDGLKKLILGSMRRVSKQFFDNDIYFTVAPRNLEN